MSGPRPERVFAVVPVRALDGAKSRLGEVLDPEERRDLVIALLERTLDAAAASTRIGTTITVSADEAVLDIARAHGAVPLHQTGGGLNAALDQARDAALDLGADELLALPGDIPGLTPEALDDLVGSLPDASSAPRLVGLVSDRHGRGTNALVLRPPDVIPFAFGGDSRLAHAGLARSAGAAYVEREGVLALDLDTPEDLIAAGADRADGASNGASGAAFARRPSSPTADVALRRATPRPTDR